MAPEETPHGRNDAERDDLCGESPENGSPHRCRCCSADRVVLLSKTPPDSRETMTFRSIGAHTCARHSTATRLPSRQLGKEC